MAKPNSASGYDGQVTESCERVLVTLLRGLGPWKESVCLVGGLAPRYLAPMLRAGKMAHAGTGDVDIRQHSHKRARSTTETNRLSPRYWKGSANGRTECSAMQRTVA